MCFMSAILAFADDGKIKYSCPRFMHFDAENDCFVKDDGTYPLCFFDKIILAFTKIFNCIRVLFAEILKNIEFFETMLLI